MRVFKLFAGNICCRTHIVYVLVDVRWSFEEPTADLIVLVDSLCSSATICSSLDAGAKRVFVEDNPEKALAYMKALKVGERSGLKLKGFDMNNLPSQVANTVKRGGDVVLCSGNFSTLLPDYIMNRVAVASLVNAKALVAYLEKKKFKRVCFVAIGTFFYGGRKLDKPFKTLEDLVACLYLAKRIKGAQYSEKALKLFGKYAQVFENEKRLMSFMKDSKYARYLVEIDKNNAADVNLCFKENAFNVVPILRKAGQKHYFEKA